MNFSDRIVVIISQTSKFGTLVSGGSNTRCFCSSTTSAAYTLVVRKAAAYTIAVVVVVVVVVVDVVVVVVDVVRTAKRRVSWRIFN